MSKGIRTCPVCGKAFTPMHKKGPQKYCGLDCGYLAKKAQRKEARRKKGAKGKRVRVCQKLKRPVTYAEIRRTNIRRGTQAGWRGAPCMGGGCAIGNNLCTPVNN